MFHVKQEGDMYYLEINTGTGWHRPHRGTMPRADARSLAHWYRTHTTTTTRTRVRRSA